ncbi:MAG: PepSY-associated TM helix domain-containing protein [Sphingobacteriia bacterium]
MNKQVARISRWLHIYLSMVSFAIVLFFSITGLTLNHADYFQSPIATSTVKGTMNKDWVNVSDTLKIDKLKLVEYFRNQYKVHGAVYDFRIDDSQITISFKSPGYEADIFVNRASGEFELAQTNAGLIAFFNDLHKGRDSGKNWSWVIDISAILLVIVSLTGLILILYIKRKRLAGLLMAIVGLLAMILIYYFWGQ